MYIILYIDMGVILTIFLLLFHNMIYIYIYIYIYTTLSGFDPARDRVVFWKFSDGNYRRFDVRAGEQNCSAGDPCVVWSFPENDPRACSAADFVSLFFRIYLCRKLFKNIFSTIFK